MHDHNPTGDKSPERSAESRWNQPKRCPKCNTPIVAITAGAPGEPKAHPCGCRLTDEEANESTGGAGPELATDGGEIVDEEEQADDRLPVRPYTDNPEGEWQYLNKIERDLFLSIAHVGQQSDGGPIRRRDVQSDLEDYHGKEMTLSTLREELNRLRYRGYIGIEQSGSWVSIEITDRGEAMLRSQYGRVRDAVGVNGR